MGSLINKTLIIYLCFIHELSLFLYYTEDAGSHGRTRCHTELQHHPLDRADLAALVHGGRASYELRWRNR